MGFIREECFKYSLMAWEKVCLPYELGGLGIRRLVSFFFYGKVGVF